MLLLMGWVVLTSLLLLAPWAPDIALAGLTLIAVFAIAALLGPVLGIHRRIRDAKHRELSRVAAALRHERGARVAAEQWQPEDARIADLIFYRQELESLNSWLFDVPTLLRFALILLVGAVSWLGQAFSERLLEALLGPG